MSHTWEVRVELTEAEYRRALRRFWVRARWYSWAILTLACGYAGVTWLSHGTSTHDPKYLVIGLAAYSFTLIVAYGSFMRSNVAEWRRLEELPVVYRFDVDGVSISSQLGSSDIKWRVFGKLWKYSGFWLLFMSKRQFLVLPTAALDADLMAFIDRQVRLGAGLPKCHECGYDLRGQEEARCPECGTEYSTDVLWMSK